MAAAVARDEGKGADSHRAAAGTISGSSNGSLWLKPERFDDPNFDAEACIADLRRFVPLPTLKAELEQYLHSLKSQLVNAINEDYHDFVSLSGRLSNLEGAVVRMRKPLLEIKAKLHGAQASVEADVQALQQGLKRRQEVASARATLECMLEAAHLASKVEKLLAELEALPPLQGTAQAAGVGGEAADAEAEAASTAAGSAPRSTPGPGAAPRPPPLGERTRLVERIAGEISRLTFLINRGQGLAFMSALAKRADAARSQLSGRLREALAAALVASHWGAAGHCLHAHVELGDAAGGEEALREHLFRPLVRGAVAAAAAAAAPGAAPPLAPAVDALLLSLRTEAAPLLDMLLATSGGLALFDVLGNCIVAEVVSALSQQLPGVFSPAHPPSFHANYLAGQRLLAGLEGLARTRTAVEQLRRCPATTALAKRWNLAVYFSLLYQDIAGSLETALEAGSLVPAPSPHPPGSPPFQLAASATLWGCLLRCASPDVVLLQLGDRFLKTACQLCARYTTWLGAVLAARREAAAAARGPGQPAAAAAAAAAAGPAAWAATAAAEELALVVADAEVLQGQLRGNYPASLAAALSQPQAGGGEAVAAAVGGALGVAAGALAEGSAGVLGAIADDVVERCVGVVKQLKGITATYRMTSKGPPVRHSHYAAGVLVPLRALLDAPGGPQALAPGARAALCERVVSGVCGRYQQLAEELLSTVRKTETSLKRLKKNRGPGDEGADVAGSMSDSDKISLQLHLDVQEFGRQAAKFGLEPQRVPGFAALVAAVAPTSGGAAPS